MQLIGSLVTATCTKLLGLLHYFGMIVKVMSLTSCGGDKNEVDYAAVNTINTIIMRFLGTNLSNYEGDPIGRRVSMEYVDVLTLVLLNGKGCRDMCQCLNSACGRFCRTQLPVGLCTRAVINFDLPSIGASASTRQMQPPGQPTCPPCGKSAHSQLLVQLICIIISFIKPQLAVGYHRFDRFQINPVRKFYITGNAVTQVQI